MGFAVEIRNLEKRYGDLLVLKNLSLEIEKGSIFGIVGPDGSGKSTLLKTICGLLNFEKGEIRILGKNLKEDFNLIKKRIGYLSQEFSLYEDLTVDENIEFFGKIYRIKDWKERREKILEFTNLTPFRKRLAEKLSGGMKKKLALACTLIHEPEIFILDEPTLGIDPVSRMEIWKIIFQLSEEGLTIILSTSYIDEAERCNKIAIIYNGEILYSGEPDFVKKMKRRVLNLTLKEPLKAFDFLKSKISEDIVISGDRIKIITENLEETKRRVEKILGENHIKIHDIQINPLSLEDYLVSILSERKGEGNN